VSGLSFQQTDSAALFAGPSASGLTANAGGTVDRLCIGAPGTVVNTVTLDPRAKNKYAVSFDIPVGQYTLWRAGTWTVRLNIAQPNPCVTWVSCFVLRLNAAGVVQQLLGSLTPPALVANLTTSGIKVAAIPCEASPTRAYFDRVLVVLGFENGSTLPPNNLTLNTTAQVFGFVADQLIDSPLIG
jgi:hypothetical protein